MLGTSVTGSSPHFDLQISNIPFPASIFNWISHFDDMPSVFFAGISFSSTACTFFVTGSSFLKILFFKGSLMVPHPHSCRRNLSDLPTILIKRWQDWPVSWKSSSWHFSARPGRPSYFACLTTKRNHLNTALVWPRATNSYIFTFFDGKCVLSLIDPNLKDDHIGSM